MSTFKERLKSVSLIFACVLQSFQIYDITQTLRPFATAVELPCSLMVRLFKCFEVNRIIILNEQVMPMASLEVVCLYSPS
jgi:hypothetical protein